MGYKKETKNQRIKKHDGTFGSEKEKYIFHIGFIIKNIK